MCYYIFPWKYKLFPFPGRGLYHICSYCIVDIHRRYVGPVPNESWDVRLYFCTKGYQSEHIIIYENTVWTQKNAILWKIDAYRLLQSSTKTSWTQFFSAYRSLMMYPKKCIGVDGLKKTLHRVISLFPWQPEHIAYQHLIYVLTVINSF